MDRKIAKALALITQLGFSMLVPIAFCLYVGVKLDEYFGTSPILLFVFILLGVGAGFRSVYMITRPFFKDKDTFIDIDNYRQKEKRNEKGDKS